MTIFELMDSCVNKYTKTELLIYEYTKKLPEKIAGSSITDLNKSFEFSQASLTRFAQKLGFEGFTQFQYQLKADLKSKNKKPSELTAAQFYGEFLQTVQATIKEEDLQQIAKKFLKANKILFVGNSLSNIPAQYMDFTAKISLDKVTASCEASTSTIWNMDDKDMVIAYSSYSGFNLKRFSLFPKKPYMVLVTLTNKHPMRSYFEKVIVLPKAKSIDHHNVLTETFAYLLFNDLLSHKINALKK